MSAKYSKIYNNMTRKKYFAPSLVHFYFRLLTTTNMEIYSNRAPNMESSGS